MKRPGKGCVQRVRRPLAESPPHHHAAARVFPELLTAPASGRQDSKTFRRGRAPEVDIMH